MRPVPRPKNHIDSFRYAVEGIAHVFRTQRHMRFHFIIVVLVLTLGLLCRFDAMQMAMLGLVCASVIVSEMLNTAVETVVDMITQSYHPLAKLAKDIAAGAVLVSAIGAASVGALLFVARFAGSQEKITLHYSSTHELLPVALIVVIVLVLVISVIVKVLGERGTMLQGGIISGHAAVAFVIAMCVAMRAGMEPFTLLLVLILALLVAQARVEGKIHSLQEVIIGGLLGICVTAGVYFFQVGGR
ncbi:MAG: diacylglycerol kinase [Capsulimonadaceae bacterium]|nr:diacylglycerol kinase [Capsulimonadaceae bacterium]